MCYLCVCQLQVFYYTLGNIGPMFRSRLQVIQLISVAKNSGIRQYGFDTLIQNFITNVNTLGKVDLIGTIYLHLYSAVLCTLYVL